MARLAACRAKHLLIAAGRSEASNVLDVATDMMAKPASFTFLKRAFEDSCAPEACTVLVWPTAAARNGALQKRSQMRNGSASRNRRDPGRRSDTAMQAGIPHTAIQNRTPDLRRMQCVRALKASPRRGRRPFRYCTLWAAYSCATIIHAIWPPIKVCIDASEDPGNVPPSKGIYE
jgi:hypothetical protein